MATVANDAAKFDGVKAVRTRIQLVHDELEPQLHRQEIYLILKNNLVPATWEVEVLDKVRGHHQIVALLTQGPPNDVSVFEIIDVVPVIIQLSIKLLDWVFEPLL